MSQSRKFLIISLYLLLIPSSYPQKREYLTITTYYPAPYGVYKELRSKRMAIGDTYFENSNHPWDTDGFPLSKEIPQDADLVVEGKVGIGTHQPGALLNVYEDLNSGSVGSNPMEAQVILGDNSARLYLGSYYESGVFSGATIQASDYYGGSDHGIRLLLNPNGGNVGIGTTNPGAKLEIKGNYPLIKFNSSSIYGTVLTFFNDYDSANSHWRINAGGQDTVRKDKLNFVTANDAGSWTSSVMTLQQNGNVGIGTTNPQAKLQVAGTISTTQLGSFTIGFQGGSPYYGLRMDTNASGGWAREVSWSHSGSKVGSIGMHGSGSTPSYLYFNAQQSGANTGHSSPDMVITSSGKVGIGTTSPQAELDVNGTIRVGNGKSIIEGIVAGTIRLGPKGQATSISGNGFWVSPGPFNEATSCVWVHFNTPFSNPPHIIVQRNSNSGNHYQWKPGAYNTDRNKFELCATYREYDGPTGEWVKGSVGFSFIAVGD